MTTPVVRVELNLSGTTWTDVSEWVVPGSLHFSRGATSNDGPWFHTQVGTFSCSLYNSISHDGVINRFDPLNTSGVYTSGGVSLLRPGLGLRVSVLYPDASVDIMWGPGSVDTWEPIIGEGRWSEISVTATDQIETLQQATVVATDPPVGDGETAPQRLNRILDNIGYAGARSIANDNQANTMQATDLSKPAWTEMVLTADSDNGYLFMSRDGTVTYVRRPALSSSATVTFNGVGASGSQLRPLPGLGLSYDRAQVFNEIQISRVAHPKEDDPDDVPMVEVEEDSTSQGLNGVRAYSRTDLVCDTDAGVDSVAYAIMFQYATLRFRVEQLSIRISAVADPVAVWHLVAQMDLIELAQVTYQTSSATTRVQLSLIRGISWQADAAGFWVITVSFIASPRPPGITPFILGTSVLGGTDVLSPY